MSRSTHEKVEPIIDVQRFKDSGPPTLAWIRAQKREDDTFATEVRLTVRLPDTYEASTSPNPGVYAADGHAVVGPVLKTKAAYTDYSPQEYAIYTPDPRHVIQVRNVTHADPKSVENSKAVSVPLVLECACQETTSKGSAIQKAKMYATPLAFEQADIKTKPLTLADWAKRGVYSNPSRAGGDDVAKEVHVRVRGPLPSEYAVVSEHTTSKRAHAAVQVHLDRTALDGAVPGSTLTIPLCIVPLHPVLQGRTVEVKDDARRRLSPVPAVPLKYDLFVRVPVQCSLLPDGVARNSSAYRSPANPVLKIPTTLVLETALDDGGSSSESPVVKCTDRCRLRITTERLNNTSWKVNVQSQQDPRAYDSDECVLRVEALDGGSMPVDGYREPLRNPKSEHVVPTVDTQISKIAITYADAEPQAKRYIRPIIEKNPQDGPCVDVACSPFYGDGADVYIRMGNAPERGRSRVACKRTLGARQGKIWVSFAFGSVPHGDVDKDRKIKFSLYAKEIRSKGPKIEVPGAESIPIGAPQEATFINLDLTSAMHLPSPSQYGCYIDPGLVPASIQKVQLMISIVGLGGTDYAPDVPHDGTVDVPLCILHMPHQGTRTEGVVQETIRLGGWVMGTNEDGSLMFSYKRFEDEMEMPRMIFSRHDVEM